VIGAIQMLLLLHNYWGRKSCCRTIQIASVAGKVRVRVRLVVFKPQYTTLFINSKYSHCASVK